MDSQKDVAQGTRYRQLITAAFEGKAPGDDEASTELLLYVLELLTSSDHATPEERLAAWLRDAL